MEYTCVTSNAYLNAVRMILRVQNARVRVARRCDIPIDHRAYTLRCWCTRNSLSRVHGTEEKLDTHTHQSTCAGPNRRARERACDRSVFRMAAAENASGKRCKHPLISRRETTGGKYLPTCLPSKPIIIARRFPESL